MSFRVPGLGRSSTTDWDIEGTHLAERCGLFVIIALGESILVTGAGFAELEWNTVTITGFLIAFVGAVAMWWLYFDTGAIRASRRIARADDPGRQGRLAYTYIHLLIVAGRLGIDGTTQSTGASHESSAPRGMIEGVIADHALRVSTHCDELHAVRADAQSPQLRNARCKGHRARSGIEGNILKTLVPACAFEDEIEATHPLEWCGQMRNDQVVVRCDRAVDAAACRDLILAYAHAGRLQLLNEWQCEYQC